MRSSGYYAAFSGSYLPTVVGFLTLEDGTDRLSRNVGKELCTRLRNRPEVRSSQVLNSYMFRHRGDILGEFFFVLKLPEDGTPVPKHVGV